MLFVRVTRLNVFLKRHAVLPVCNRSVAQQRSVVQKEEESMNIPGFYAEASLEKSDGKYRVTTSRSGSGDLVHPSLLRIPRIPILTSPGVDWGCYEICAQHCSSASNLQACQRDCLNQCGRTFTIF